MKLTKTQQNIIEELKAPNKQIQFSIFTREQDSRRYNAIKKLIEAGMLVVVKSEELQAYCGARQTKRSYKLRTVELNRNHAIAPKVRKSKTRDQLIEATRNYDYLGSWTLTLEEKQIIQFYLDGKSMSQVAKEIGISTSRVNSKLKKLVDYCRHQLRNMK
jgi:DNA-binding CsgD family transcriptional regulator